MAGREGVAAPTLSRSAEELLRRGLVERRVDPSDARSAFMSLTDEGRAVVGLPADARTTLLASRLGELDLAEITAIKAAIPALRKLSGRPRDTAR